MRPIADYPKHAELDALVAAFEAGNYRRVRHEAPRLAAREDVDPEVRSAAKELVARTEADPIARWLLVLTGALLLLLAGYWIAQAGGGPPKGAVTPATPIPPPRTSVEIIH